MTTIISLSLSYSIKSKSAQIIMQYLYSKFKILPSVHGHGHAMQHTQLWSRSILVYYFGPVPTIRSAPVASATRTPQHSAMQRSAKAKVSHRGTGTARVNFFCNGAGFSREFYCGSLKRHTHDTRPRKRHARAHTQRRLQ